jgi:hypothetical protein
VGTGQALAVVLGWEADAGESAVEQGPLEAAGPVSSSRFNMALV